MRCTKLRQAVAINIFFHVAEIGNRWRQIADEIKQSIYDAGLPEPKTGVLGYDPYGSEIYRHPQLNAFEFPTLYAMWCHAKLHPEDYLLYVHTKGVSKPDRMREWRRYMLWACVTHWRGCITALDSGADTVGASWQVEGYAGLKGCAGFWPGNFFWANASYIASLPNPTDDMRTRFKAETWIGLNRSVKPFSIHILQGDFIQNLKTLKPEIYDV